MFKKVWRFFSQGEEGTGGDITKESAAEILNDSGSEQWDAYEQIRKSPSKKIIQESLVFINYLSEENVSRLSHIIVTPYGAVTLEFRGESERMNLEISEEGYNIFILDSKEHVKYAYDSPEFPLGEKTMSSLIDKIDKLK